MANTKYIRVPFASDGDTTPVPNDTQSDGTLSWAQGWGPDYQRDLTNDANAKAIERDTMNQLFFVLSSIAQWYQENNVPEFITSDQNNGQAYSYMQGASVVYTDDSGSRSYWTSIVDNNTDTPGASSDKWKPYVFRTANTSEVTAKQGNYPVTPQQVVDLIYSTVEYPQATTTQRGIVQLSDSLNSTADNQAATPNAVSQKLTHFKDNLDERDLNTIVAFSQRAVYYQSNSDLATYQRNYPVEEAGVLLCLGQVNNGVLQIYFSENAQFWARARSNNTSGNEVTWNAWRQIQPVIQDATTQQKGVVQLSNRLYGSLQTRAATELALGQKLNYSYPDLGVKNIDNLIDIGVFYQKSSGDATKARGYPVASTGQLLITGDDTIRQQTYFASMGKVFMRTQPPLEGGWSEWETTPPGVPTGAIMGFAFPGRAAAPDGWLVCSGGLVNRDDYPDLFKILGTSHNTGGESSSQFRLPNIRPNYTLIANNGSGTTNLTSDGDVKSHNHAGSATNPAGAHVHNLTRYRGQDGSGGNGITSSSDSPSDKPGSYPSSQYVQSAGVHTHTLDLKASGGPINAAAGLYTLMCIKY